LCDSLKDVPSRPNCLYISVFKKDGKPKDVIAIIDTGSLTSNCISENLYASIGIRHDGARSVLRTLNGGELRAIGMVELKFRILETDFAGRPSPSGAFQRGGKPYSERFHVVPGALPHMVISGKLDARLNLLDIAVALPPSLGPQLEKATLNICTKQEYQDLLDSLRSQQQGQSGYEDPRLARPRPLHPSPSFEMPPSRLPGRPKPQNPEPQPPPWPRPPKLPRPGPYCPADFSSDNSSSGDEDNDPRSQR
jgi:hypothetical protein